MMTKLGPYEFLLDTFLPFERSLPGRRNIAFTTSHIHIFSTLPEQETRPLALSPSPTSPRLTIGQVCFAYRFDASYPLQGIYSGSMHLIFFFSIDIVRIGEFFDEVLFSRRVFRP